MKKFAVITVLGLALLLMGLTLSASAVTVNDVTNGEQHLFEVVQAMGGGTYSTSQLFVDANAPVDTLSTVGVNGTWSYAVTGIFYTGAGWSQDPATNPAGSATPLTFVPSALFPASGNQYVTIGNVPITPFTTAGSFGFADVLGNGGTGTRYTQSLFDSPAAAQPHGLIFQVSDTQFIVAFEDGGSSGGLANLGDTDYNDLVLNVTRTFVPVPLPPSALLLGSGLLGLVGLGWRRRRQAS